MPFCANCGHEVAEGVAFCPQCGAAQGGVAVASAYAPAREYAGFGARFVGLLIDLVITGVASAAIGAVERSIFGFSVISNFVGLAYTWYFTAIGQSLGQGAMGIRTINAAGEPPGAGRALGRILASILSAIPLGLGYLWAAWHPETRTWHDSIAGTWVIRA